MRRALVLTCLLSMLVAPLRAADPLADFGGEEGLNKLTDQFIQRVLADPRIGQRFAKVDTERLTFLIFHQFCQYLGGSCIYKGKTMRESHTNMHVRTAELNAMVEDLEVVMRARKIPYAAQSRLISKLAPLKRDIVGH